MRPEDVCVCVYICIEKGEISLGGVVYHIVLGQRLPIFTSPFMVIQAPEASSK